MQTDNVKHGFELFRKYQHQISSLILDFRLPNTHEYIDNHEQHNPHGARDFIRSITVGGKTDILTPKHRIFLVSGDDQVLNNILDDFKTDFNANPNVNLWYGSYVKEETNDPDLYKRFSRICDDSSLPYKSFKVKENNFKKYLKFFKDIEEVDLLNRITQIGININNTNNNELLLDNVIKLREYFEAMLKISEDNCHHIVNTNVRGFVSKYLNSPEFIKHETIKWEERIEEIHRFQS